MRYELFYSTGGHGGPYYDLEEAIRSAKRLLKGNRNERYINILQDIGGPLCTVVDRFSQHSVDGKILDL